MKQIIRTLGVVLLVLCLFSVTAHASVVIGGTRVVFPAPDGEVTVRLSNEATRPALIEAWIDSGNPQSTPDTAHVPFLITPPLFRMEARKDQSLRIIATPAQLPADRESLFWLNVLEIPPKATSAETAGKNVLQLAIRSRLKLFYRPARLTGDPLKAPTQLTWTVVTDGSSLALEAHNPTPYHITISGLSLVMGGRQYEADTGMVDPMSSLRLRIKGPVSAPPSGTPITFDIINDYGATASYKGIVGPS